MVVRYAAEDLVGVGELDQDAVRFATANANRYPKRILYGNQAPLGELDGVSDKAIRDAGAIPVTAI